MDSDPDYEWDGGGFSDYDDDYYDGNFHDYYHDHYHSSDFHVGVDIGGVDYFRNDSDSDTLPIAILPSGDDRDDEINGDGDLAGEIGLYGGGDDINGDGDLAAEIGLYVGGDDSHGDGDLAAELGMNSRDGDINGDGDLTAEIDLGGGDDDIDGGSDRHLTEELGIGSGSYRVDGWDEAPFFMYSSRHNLRPGTALRFQFDLPVTRDGNTSTRQSTVQSSQSLIESNSNPIVRRNEEEKDGDLAKKLKNGEMASSSEEGKKELNANGSEDDGVSCPICLESWTTDGDHIICCLPCGHVYGLSCIKSWLQQPNSGKCPQCNKVCSVVDIRKIYGLTIVRAEKDLKEKIQLLEAKCASLELYNADLQRKEAEWRRLEAVLVQQLKLDAE